MKRALGAMIFLVALGCGAKDATSTEPPPNPSMSTATPPKDEATTLQEQIRAGAYQIDAAMGALERAMNLVRPLAKENAPALKEPLANIAEMLDSAGATIMDFNDAPSLDAVRSDFKKHDDHRLKAIEEANDARREIDEARGIVADLLQSGAPVEAKTKLQEIQDAIEEALDGLEEGIQSFGGQVDVPSESDEGAIVGKSGGRGG